MKKVENYLETLKLKKCLFGGIAPKQIEIVIQEICMLYDLELYNKNNELEQERKKMNSRTSGWKKYRSMPAKMEARSELAQTLSRIHDLDGVPGFYRSENGDWRLAGNSGLLIPYCTAKGYTLV